jgi:hypothetical protein
MEFPVTLFLDPQNPLSVRLRLSDDPFLRFSFADTDGSPIAEDPITSFARIEFRPEPLRHLVFAGPSVTRSVVFETDEDYSQFLQALASRLVMNPQESNPSAMSLVHEAPNRHSERSLVACLFRAIQDRHFPHLARRPVDGIVSGPIDVSVPCQPAAFNIEAARGDDLRTVNWALLKVPDDAWPAVFQLLLSASRPPDYEDLSEQWRLTTVGQWNQHLLLRQFVAGLDNWLLHSQLPSKGHKQAFFNVMMGLFTESFATLVLDDGVLFVCDLIFRLFVRNATDDGAFVLATGDVLP